MAQPNVHYPFVLNVLQNVTTERLQKAVNAMADATLTGLPLPGRTPTPIRLTGLPFRAMK